jgi:hypothetical protein
VAPRVTNSPIRRSIAPRSWMGARRVSIRRVAGSGYPVSSIPILAGALHAHGHKTALNWIITGVVVAVLLSYRVIRSLRSRSQK